MQKLKDEFPKILAERKNLRKKINSTQHSIQRIKNKIIISRIFIYGFFSNKLSQQLVDLQKEEINIRKELSETKIALKYNLDENDKSKSLITDLQNKFKELSKSEKIWDITNSQEVTENKSSATTSIKRIPTKIEMSDFELIKCDIKGLLFKNKNGRNIIFYPSFMISWEHSDNYEIYFNSEIKVEFRISNFLEEETIPSDSEVIGETWRKVNKDGSPDKRFKGNYKIPIVKYAEITYHFGNSTETFQFSNYTKALEFSEDHHIILTHLQSK